MKTEQTSWRKIISEHNYITKPTKNKKILNYLIGALAALILFIHSVIYKSNYEERYKKFWNLKMVHRSDQKNLICQEVEKKVSPDLFGRERVETVAPASKEANLSPLLKPQETEPKTIALARNSECAIISIRPTAQIDPKPKTENHWKWSKWAAALILGGCATYALGQTGWLGCLGGGSLPDLMTPSISATPLYQSLSTSSAKLSSLIPTFASLGRAASLFAPLSGPVEPPDIQFFTSYTTDQPDRLSLSRKVRKSHEEYCKEKGYAYVAIEENMAPDSLPYWSKIGGINRMLQHSSDKKWIVWLDDDAVVTNPHIRMEKYIAEHGGYDSNIHVLVTTDIPTAETRLNTGVLIVRNSELSRRFFKDLWDKRKNRIENEAYTYSNCPHQKCLHEQQAMDDLLREKPEYTDFVKIIPQRDSSGMGLNTFKRWNHYDVTRDITLIYNSDYESSCNPSTDYICQCTGLATNGKSSPDAEESPRNFREECIDSLIAESKRK